MLDLNANSNTISNLKACFEDEQVFGGVFFTKNNFLHN